MIRLTELPSPAPLWPGTYVHIRFAEPAPPSEFEVAFREGIMRGVAQAWAFRQFATRRRR